MLITVSTYILPNDENPYEMDIWPPMLQTLANNQKNPQKLENYKFTPKNTSVAEMALKIGMAAHQP
jgi:hypothetical protein